MTRSSTLKALRAVDDSFPSRYPEFEDAAGRFSGEKGPDDTPPLTLGRQLGIRIRFGRRGSVLQTR
jgi:hypothetical protein